jgi:hypothetical protein
MANKYTWVIESLDCVSSLEGQNDVVATVHWRVNAVSDQGTTVEIDNKMVLIPYTTTIYGAQPLTFNAKSAFTSYADLTKDTVVGWVQAAMGIDDVTRLQEALDKRLETLANPPVITPPLPWAE